MPKFTTNISGNVRGIVQGAGASLTITDGQVTHRYTTEPCPQCRGSAQCEHGVRDDRNRPIHVWTCQFCGELSGILGYDCENCR